MISSVFAMWHRLSWPTRALIQASALAAFIVII